MEIQVFRNANSSQTNAYSHYSNYSYSGLIRNERALSDMTLILDQDLFPCPCGTLDSATLVTAHVLYILVNHKVKGCLYVSHKKSPDSCGTNYSVHLLSAQAQHLCIVKVRTKPCVLIGCRKGCKHLAYYFNLSI